MTRIKLIGTVEVGNTLGECVLWNERQQSVWWTDIHESRLYQYDLDGGTLNVHELPERLASFGFTETDGTLICAFASGIALYHLESGQVAWLARPEMDVRGTRFNDGRVDRQGRFWAGTMVEQPTASSADSGSLYCVTRGDCRRIFSGLQIPNSICWSPDSSSFFCADSTSHTIQRYAFNSETGSPSDPEVFAKIAPPVEPDGSTTDAEGFLWNAHWGGGKVVRYDSNGEPADEVVLPVSQPTCVALGGRDLNLLFVTTAKVSLTSEQLASQPAAGNLFIYATPYSGLPESHFKI